MLRESLRRKNLAGVVTMVAAAAVLSACGQYQMAATVTEKPAGPAQADLKIALSANIGNALESDPSTPNLRLRITEVIATGQGATLVSPANVSSGQCGVSPAAPTTDLTCGAIDSGNNYKFDLKVPQIAPGDVYRVDFFDTDGNPITTSITYSDGLS